ncbi:MAG: sugar ABC transporter ATP-binding protein [Firmicutes bacterium]|nr:sugar ABC transporter ATP-binding protein [Bacillota bacterium]
MIPSAAVENDLLRMENISKAFPGVQALAGVQFDLRAGEVHALLGENGAGKTTLMNVLGGVVIRDAGEIYIGGRLATIRSPQDAQKAGIAFVHQELNLIEPLSVKENMFIGRELVNRWRLIDWKAATARARKVLADLQVPVHPDDRIADLPMALRQMVEIAKALCFDAKIFVMDEPTSALTVEETGILFHLIRRLRDEGKGIIYITHRLEEIFELSDRVTVLRNGRYVGTRETARTNRDELVRMMVGREVLGPVRERRQAPGETVLEVEGLTGVERVRNVSFQLRTGEIVGIAGLQGSGRTELLEMIFGARRVRSGTMRLKGRPYAPRQPRDAVRMGIAYVPEDRERKGLFLDFDVKTNMRVTGSELEAKGGWMRERGVVPRLLDLIARLDVQTPSIHQTVKNLSGGNRQKVVFAKMLYTAPQVLLVNEPTRGVDVGARAEIYDILHRLSEEGVAILLSSSELPELFSVCDRIWVMSEGRFVASFERDEATQEAIME